MSVKVTKEVKLRESKYWLFYNSMAESDEFVDLAFELLLKVNIISGIIVWIVNSLIWVVEVNYGQF